MLLELLSAGLLVGGALAVLVLDTERSMPTGPGGGPPPLGARRLGSDPPGSVDDGPRLTDRGGPVGGALARPSPAPGGARRALGGGAGLEEAERGAPFGGGGVDFLTLSSAPPALLLTQRLSSGS